MVEACASVCNAVRQATPVDALPLKCGYNGKTLDVRAGTLDAQKHVQHQQLNFQPSTAELGGKKLTCADVASSRSFGGCAGTLGGCCWDGVTPAGVSGCPPKSQGVVGGCGGVEGGCCWDGVTARASGCPERPSGSAPAPIVGGCAGTLGGCCPDGITPASAGCAQPGVPKCSGGANATRFGCCADGTPATYTKRRICEQLTPSAYLVGDGPASASQVDVQGPFGGEFRRTTVDNGNGLTGKITYLRGPLGNSMTIRRRSAE